MPSLYAHPKKYLSYVTKLLLCVKWAVSAREVSKDVSYLTSVLNDDHVSGGIIMKWFNKPQIKMFSTPLEGIVEKAISCEKLRVKFRCSYWPAKLYQSNQEMQIAPGQTVDVVGREGITLLVRLA